MNHQVESPLIPELPDFEFMFATKRPPFSKAGWIFEPKFDGYRVLCVKDFEGVRLISRNRKNASTWFPELVVALERLPGRWVIDAEACVVNEQGLPAFERLRARTRTTNRTDPVALYAFDVLAHNGKDLRQQPLLKRKQRLKKVMPAGHPLLHLVPYVEQEGKQLYAAMIEMGMEGVVGKKADSPYVAGRSDLWRKSKPAGFHDGWKRRRL